MSVVSVSINSEDGPISQQLANVAGWLGPQAATPTQTALPALNPSPAGSYGDKANAANVTVNAQGLVTAASSVPFPAPTIVASLGLPKPANQVALQSLLNSVDGKTAFNFAVDPTTSPIQLSSPLVVNLVNTGGGVDGALSYDFGRIPLLWTGTDGTTPGVVFQGASTHLTVSGINFFGNAFASAGCGVGVVFQATTGAILLANIRGINASWCGQHGVVFVGNFYESTIYELDCKDNLGNGCMFVNSWGVLGATANGVISNVRVISPDLSRNNSYGLALGNGVTSVDLPAGGSFINNWLGGVQNAPRFMCGVNGENTGPALVDATNGITYPLTMVGCNLTSDMGTAHTPSLVSTTLVKYAGTNGDGHLNLIGCYVTPEGTAQANQLSLVHA